MMNNHQEQWQKIQSAFANKRVPQSMLLVGPLHCELGLFVRKTMSLLLCKSGQNEPCLKCGDCQMVERMEHPDVEWIKPEKNGGAIKVDQIRELQSSAYLTPQRSTYRLIVIESADRMNTASANALLKILEEPAQHTVFILIAQQLSTVLPTVLSRCHIITFSPVDNSASNNLLTLGEHYSQESERAVLFNQADVILDGLIALIERKQHPCVLAAQWTQYELGSFLWFLYLVYSQIQNMHVMKTTVTGPATLQLGKLLTLLSPLSIFAQIDKINTLLRKISHNMNVNHTLVLEDLLFSLIPGT
nr:DNA polymerase III subunit delta' [Legionella bononiensis]